MKNSLILSIILICWVSVAFASEAFYVDCSQPTNGDGSYETPWNNVGSVAKYAFNTGDDVYFKVNTTCFPSGSLFIDWDGTEKDSVIIGAYHGDRMFGLNGKERPAIDGQNSVPGDETALIEKKGGIGYITIENLEFRNSSGIGIKFDQTANITVKNCYTYHTHRRGIELSQTHNGLIENNTVEEASHDIATGAGILVTAMFYDGSAQNVKVIGNTVFNSFEGIGLYKQASHCTVESNIVYDNRSYQIYLATGSHHCTVRYNTIYSSLKGNTGSAIVMNCEGHDPPRCDKIDYCSDFHEVYGNVIAGVGDGISILSNCNVEPDIHLVSNNKVYNNTIVDSVNYNLRIKNTGNGNDLRNNISWTISSGSKHINVYSPSGVIWRHNNFDDPVTGNANNLSVIGNPNLKKTSGWRSIMPGLHDRQWWELQSGSICESAGIDYSGSKVDIGSYPAAYRDPTADVGGSVPAVPTNLRIVQP